MLDRGCTIVVGVYIRSRCGTEKKQEADSDVESPRVGSKPPPLAAVPAPPETPSTTSENLSCISSPATSPRFPQQQQQPPHPTELMTPCPSLIFPSAHSRYAAMRVGRSAWTAAYLPPPTAYPQAHGLMEQDAGDLKQRLSASMYRTPTINNNNNDNSNNKWSKNFDERPHHPLVTPHGGEWIRPTLTPSKAPSTLETSSNREYAAISTDAGYKPPSLKQTTTFHSSELMSEWKVFRILHTLRPTATGSDQIPAWILRLGAPLPMLFIGGRQPPKIAPFPWQLHDFSSFTQYEGRPSAYSSALVSSTLRWVCIGFVIRLLMRLLAHTSQRHFVIPVAFTTREAQGKTYYIQR